MSKDFYSAILNRRSFYAISKKSPISDNKIEEVIGHAIKHTPSAFNSQSSKVVFTLWRTARQALGYCDGDTPSEGACKQIPTDRGQG